MAVRLIEIPGIEAQHQRVWRIRVLEINGRNLVLEKLHEWSQKNQADYKKIMKVLRILGQHDRIRDPKKVKKSTNPDHGDVYEVRADKGGARIMFFYDRKDQSVVVCTNTYWKAKSSQREQDAAFERCNQLRKFYEHHA
jgi:hypothetical protein